jgi:hypothetical protein
LGGVEGNDEEGVVDVEEAVVVTAIKFLSSFRVAWCVARHKVRTRGRRRGRGMEQPVGRTRSSSTIALTRRTALSLSSERTRARLSVENRQLLSGTRGVPTHQCGSLTAASSCCRCSPKVRRRLKKRRREFSARPGVAGGAGIGLDGHGCECVQTRSRRRFFSSCRRRRDATSM